MKRYWLALASFCFWLADLDAARAIAPSDVSANFSSKRVVQPRSLAQIPGQIPPDPQDLVPIEPTPPIEPDPTPAPLPPPDDLLRPLPNSPLSPAPELNIPGTITVERFDIVGNTVFDENELAAVTDNYVGRDLTFRDLFEVRAALTQLYVDAGYITSGAFLPADQVIENGVVQIRVIEGELEAINVVGLKRLDSDYVRDRARIAAGRPLNVNNLLEGLQLLQINPLIETISADLAAGTRTGRNILNLTVEQADTLEGQVVLDNGRSPSVGSFRRRAQVTEANLLGKGDSLSLSYSNTAGSNTWDANYSYPWNPRNGTVDLLFSLTNSNVIESPFDILDINSESRTLELTVRQPVVQTPTEEIALSLGISNRFSGTSIAPAGTDRIGFRLSEGANDEGETRLTALRFTQEWTRRAAQQVLAFRSQLSVGTDWLGATDNPTSPDGQFWSWQGQAQWVRLFDEDKLLLARFNTQLADRPLLSLEQFAVGGQGSVRGYRQDQLLADNGIFASVEVRIPVYEMPDWDSTLQVVPFADYGRVWNRGRPDPDPQQLASVGVGLLLQVSDRVTARLDYGIPLISVDTGDDSFQEQGFLFTVSGRLF